LRQRTPLMPAKKKSPVPSETGGCRHRTPPSCAIASIIKTPGMMGRSGKWPVNWGSFMVTFLIPTTRLPGSSSTTLSTRRKGYRCGRIFAMSSTVATGLTPAVTLENPSAPRHAAPPSGVGSAAVEAMARGRRVAGRRVRATRSPIAATARADTRETGEGAKDGAARAAGVRGD